MTQVEGQPAPATIDLQMARNLMRRQTMDAVVRDPVEGESGYPCTSVEGNVIPPVASVIVPTRNRPQALRRCLVALSRQHYPQQSFEVIVVDDGSSCPNDVMLAGDGLALTVRFSVQPHSGPATARNRGVSLARGRLLAFTDDDCEPDPDWLLALVQGSQTRPDCLLGGQTLNILSANPYATACQLTISYLYEYFNPDPENAVFFASNNMAAAAETFRRLGGFDTAFGRAAAEDRDLCDRWRDQGCRLAYISRALVNHRHELSLRGFLAQHTGYGRGAAELHRLRARRRAGRIRLEPPRFYIGLVLYPFRRARIIPALGLSLLAALTQVATAYGFFAETLATRSQTPP